MKVLPPGMQEHLDSGGTTLCWCWRLTRPDGLILGFSDHDRPLSFEGTIFEAFTGFTASEIKDSVGLNVDDLDVAGALRSQSLNEDDLASGNFDDARVEIFRVNWQDVSQRVLMRTGSLGEIKRNGTAFTAEIRGLSHYLQQPKGRLIQYGCDADLGDGRCGIDLDDPAFKGTGAVTTGEGRRIAIVSGIEAFSSQWFTRGLLRWTNGANNGQSAEVKRHMNTGGEVRLELWQNAAFDIQAGDGFSVTAGCDKQLATCRDRFANVLNFRGFPHIPGNDFVTSYPNSGDPDNDGGSRLS